MLYDNKIFRIIREEIINIGLCNPIIEAKAYQLDRKKQFKYDELTRQVISQIISPQLGYRLNDVATDENGQPLLTQHGDKQTVLQYLQRSIKNRFIFGNADVRFEPIAAKIAFTELGYERDPDITGLNNLRRILNIITSAHQEEYDDNLNGLDYQSLEDKFISKIKMMGDETRAEVNALDFNGGSRYKIYEIHNLEEAKPFYKYTPEGSRWCLTYKQNMFDSYTDNGFNNLYFAAIDGFENVEEIKKDNSPLDEYGLSLISVIVNPDGDLAYCTTRWNHLNGGTDNAMDVVTLSKVLNMNYYNVFKPNHKWQDMLEDAINKVKNGVPLENVFDEVKKQENGFVSVCLLSKWNYLKPNGEFLSNKWFDWTTDFNEYGFAFVEINDKCNYIKSDGDYLWNKPIGQWFDWCDKFTNGFACVEINDKFNYINDKFNYIKSDGDLLWNKPVDQWFDDCDKFQNGLAKVKLNGKFNFINTNGDLISDQLFDWCGDFENGFAKVELNGKFNFINTNGGLISDQLFDKCFNFENGFADVYLNGRWTTLNTKGEIVG